MQNLVEAALIILSEGFTVGDKVEITTGGSMKGQKGIVTWVNGDGTHLEVNLGKGRDGKNNEYSFSSREVKKI